MTPAEKRRDAHLRRTYDISLVDYLKLYEAQDGVCAVCGKVPKFGKNLSVDHDHVLKRVRGLLCHYCNLRIVGKHRNPDLLYAAAQYLEFPPAYVILPSTHLTPTKKRQPRKRPRKKP